MGLFDSLFQGTPGSSAGPLSRLTGAGGILSTDILSQRMSLVKTASTPMEKVTTLVGTLGMRFKAPAAGSSGAPAAQMETGYNVPVFGEYLAAPVSPPAARVPTVETSPVQFA